MAYIKSTLNDPYHGDFVLAVTQGGINAVMMDYISTPPFLEVTRVWVMNTDPYAGPVEIDFKKLLELTDNTDPFTVPDHADHITNEDAWNLTTRARFLGGFRARIGLPDELPDDANMVTLGDDVTSVKFGLMCSKFDVIHNQFLELQADLQAEPFWMH